MGGGGGVGGGAVGLSVLGLPRPLFWNRSRPSRSPGTQAFAPYVIWPEEAFSAASEQAPLLFRSHRESFSESSVA